MKMRQEFMTGIFCVISAFSQGQYVNPTFVASVSEPERMTLVKSNVPLTEWHEASFWEQYTSYRNEIRDVSMMEYNTIQALVNSSLSHEEAWNKGIGMIDLRLNEIAITRRHYSEISALHNGIIALRFLQTEISLNMIENWRVFGLTELRTFQLRRDAISTDRYREAKYNTMAKALSLSPDEAVVFLPLYTRYEQECEELLGEQYDMYGLFAGEASDFTPGIAKRQGQDLLTLMEREIRLKEKYFHELNNTAGPKMAARFLAWEEYHSLNCKLNAFLEEHLNSRQTR